MLNPDKLPRPNGYSQVVEVRGGRTVYISGQVSLDEHNKLVGAGDFAAQARQTFENVRRALGAVGLTFEHVVKVQISLTEMEYLPSLRAVRDEFVNTARPPASTAVQVSALFRPDVLFEMDVIAVG
jgi:enamine deaminase RidA (YjgF/YER057c/UK114 family)